MLSSLKNRKGQAVVEMAISLPFLIWLIYYTINAYYSMRTAQVGQKYAAMNLYQRTDYRANFVVDKVADPNGRLAARNFLAVQYQNANERNTPKRKIVKGPISIETTVGICREPRCD